MTMTKIWGLTFVCLAWMVPGEAQSRDAVVLARLPETTNAVPVGDARPVWGWVDFCRRYAGQCDVPRLPARDVRLDAGAWNVLIEVNR